MTRTLDVKIVALEMLRFFDEADVAFRADYSSVSGTVCRAD